MKKIVLTLGFVLCCCMSAFSQATSLTVDSQTPGWLSSMISYEDQQTLHNIKITGYVNASDLTFLGSLSKNQVLDGVIDLEDANIVGSKSSENNKITKGYFRGHLQHLILPKSLESATECLTGVTLDSLTIGGESLPIISSGMFYDEYYEFDGSIFNRSVKHLILREGVTTIQKGAFWYANQPSEERCVFESIVFPSSLVTIGECAFTSCFALKKADFTENIEEIGECAFAGVKIYSQKDTIFLPSKLKTFNFNTFASSYNNSAPAYNKNTTGCHINQHYYIPQSVETINSTNVSSGNSSNWHIANNNPPVFSQYKAVASYLVVYVPKNSVEIYKNTSPWDKATILAEPNPAKSINIEQDSIKIIRGGTEQLNADVMPEDADDKTLTWSSSNSTIASVSANGLITARSSGETIIYARLNVNKSIVDSCFVVVYQPVETVSLEKHSISLKVGETETLRAQITPSSADNKTIVWSSSNKQIVSVDANGNVVASKAGEAWIKAVSEDKSGAKDSCLVTVVQPVTGITLSKESHTFDKTGESIHLEVTVHPEDASNKEVRWSSSNENVCIVNKGLVTAVAPGTAVITVTAEDGNYKANCIIKVLQHVIEIKLNKNTLTLKVEEEELLTATIAPDNADNKAIKWSSSNEQIASVDNNGNVVALKAGEVWVKVVSEDNAEAKDSCKVTVTQPVTGITLNHSSCELNSIGESVVLEANVLPEDASNKNVKWSSSNESVCVVSRGVVVAVGEGTSVIIANTEDGGYIATCTITVKMQSGIYDIGQDGASFYQIFDDSGMRRTKFQPGVNIIRFSDGTTKKVLVK